MPPPDNWASSWGTGTAAGDEIPEATTSSSYPGREGIHAPYEPTRAPEPFQAADPEWLSRKDAEPPVAKQRSLFRLIFLDILFPLTVALGIALFAQKTIAKPYQIPSGSMLPTIQLYDRILANRIIYRFTDIKQGDVIVFQPPASAADQNTPYVKRVVGLPGDVVEIRGGEVKVNGIPYVVEGAQMPAYTKNPEQVPEGQLFVLGDNRNESSDSHIWGYVPMDNVIGKAQVIYWPPRHFNWIGN